MSLPAVQAGLDLDERVVRRHVAKLEAAGLLGRAPWVWGEGSVVWLTSLGIERTGLGGLRAVKAPPAPTTIAHGVLVGWSAARAEKRGRVWQSARELALDPDRWGVTMRSERGYTKQLPDLAVWLTRSGPPIALVAESGGRREDRQKKLLESWGDAILARQYARVLYDCANESVARSIIRLAKKAQLTSMECTIVVQPHAKEIANLTPAIDDADSPAPTNPPPAREGAEPPQSHEVPADRARARVAVPVEAERPALPPATPPLEMPEDVAERERRYRELFGIPEPRPCRRWRR